MVGSNPPVTAAPGDRAEGPLPARAAQQSGPEPGWREALPRLHGVRLSQSPARGAARARQLLALLAVLVMTAQPMPAAAEGCPPRPPCHGCGCAGGPGYRGPDGKCVGFRELAHKCGNPPTERCTFENAPGTGANAECAMRRPGHQ